MKWALGVEVLDQVADDVAAKLGDSDLVTGKRLQLLPVGVFHHQKYGRFEITRDTLAAMIANARKEGMDLLIDWEHKSADPAAPVSERRASGWIDPATLSVVGNWLTGIPKWTAEAARAIAAKSFRWISPEFTMDRIEKTTGQRQGPTLAAAGLTNRPFLPGQAGAALSEGWDYTPDPEGGDEVDERLKKLLDALKLSEDATEEDVVAAFETATKTPDPEIPEGVTKALSDLGMKEGDDPATFIGSIELKKDPDPGTVTLSETEVTKLRADAALGAKAAQTLKLRDAKDVVDAAIRDPKPKITPAQREYWEKRVLSEGSEVLSEFLETAPVLLNMSEIGTGGGGPEPEDTAKALSEVTDEIDKRAKIAVAAAKEDGVELSLADAVSQVLATDEGLYAKYEAARDASVE